jgi:hypothetical protein
MSKRKRGRRALIAALAVILIVIAAVTVYKAREYSAGKEYYDSLRNIGGQ